MQKKKIAVTSFIWTFGQQFGQQFISFLVQIFLARILLPQDFGTIALFTVLIVVANSLVDGGMTNSLIRAKVVDDVDLSTVFYFNILVSCLIYVIIYLISPYIADFYKLPKLENIIKVYSIIIILNSLYAVQKTKFTKELKFKMQVAVELPSLILGGILGIYLAYIGKGVWALVYMGILQSMCQLGQYWFYSDFRPKLVFDKSKFKYHYNFGYKITLSGVLNSLFDNIYPIIIGRIFSPVELGYYNRADTLKQLPVSNISKALNKVTFPLFAKYQSDNLRLKKFYSDLLGVVLFIVCPIMLLCILNSHTLIEVLLTKKWLPIVPYFEILCLVGILYPIHSYNLNILLVKGRSDLFFRLEIIKKIILMLLIVTLFRYGIHALLWGSFVNSIICFFINTHYSGKLINYNTIAQIKDLFPILLLNVICYLITYLISNYLLLFQKNTILSLIVVSSFFILVYVVLSYLIKLKEFRLIKSLLIK